MPSISFKDLTPAQFEELCYDLLRALSFVNLNWRKGSPHGITAPDNGRDIEADLHKLEIDGSQYFEHWFIECKHHKEAVSAYALQNLLDWARAERTHVALFIVSGALSNPAKDYLKTYEHNNSPAFRMKFWEFKQLEELLRNHPALVKKFSLRTYESKKRSKENVAKFRLRSMSGTQRWYKYTTNNGTDIKLPIFDYLGPLAGLELNDTLPMQPIRFQPRHFDLQAVDAEADGSFIRMKMIIPKLGPFDFQLGQKVLVSDIEFEIIGYNGESQEYGINLL